MRAGNDVATWFFDPYYIRKKILPSYERKGQSTFDFYPNQSVFWPFYFALKENRGMKNENRFQKELIEDIKSRFPKAVVLKNDPDYIQGIPDLIVLNGNRWAALEVKKSEKATHRPNQDYYISKLDEMSYARFVYPENKEEVLYELQQALRPGRKARISKCQ